MTRGTSDELSAILTKRRHKVLNCIAFDGVFQALIRIRVEIIGSDEDFSFACRHGKRPNARHDITYHLAFLERLG